MKSVKCLWAIGILTFCVISCDKNSKTQADKQPANGSVQYSVTENVSALPATVNVAEVAPHVGGGAIDGQALYNQVCAVCHQATGKGVPGAFPPLDGSPYVTSTNVERMAAIMLYGLKGEIKVLDVNYNSIMLPQKQYKDEELAAIASYIRSSWSNKASGVEPTVFKKVREKYAERGQFTIDELGAE
ncbi:MAG: cytochrome c [Proteobacteria bacterium]|nr:cytochrome c [Pseudomonadota bacterium]